MTFSDTTEGIGVSFRQTHARTDGRTDRRGSRNSYLDMVQFYQVKILSRYSYGECIVKSKQNKVFDTL